MQTREFLDTHGYPIDPKKKPTFDAKGHNVAKYIVCPIIKGLRWIGKCQKCDFFAGIKQYHGVRCSCDPTPKSQTK